MKCFEPDFQKSEGEGSRGGHVIGHTKSGDAIYDKLDKLKHHHMWGEDKVYESKHVFEGKGKARDSDEMTKFFERRFEKKRHNIPLDQRKDLWDENSWRSEHSKPTIEEFDPKDIVPSQAYINDTQLREYLHTRKLDKIPIGVKAGSKVILFDGHHHAAADVLRGDKKIKIKTIQAPGFFKHYKNLQ